MARFAAASAFVRTVGRDLLHLPHLPDPWILAGLVTLPRLEAHRKMSYTSIGETPHRDLQHGASIGPDRRVTLASCR